MVGPVDKLYETDIQRPIIAEIAPILADVKIIFDNFLVSKYAVAAGVINIATTRIAPTVFNDTTVTKVKSNINK